MSYRSIFDAKVSGTNFRAVFDFTSGLTVGETLASASTAATVYSGTDASPSAIISGSSTISDSKVTQTITGGVIGVTYLLKCSVTTSLGKALESSGFLVMKANDA